MMRSIHDLPLDVLLHIGEFLTSQPTGTYSHVYDEQGLFAAILDDLQNTSTGILQDLAGIPVVTKKAHLLGSIR
jgi:hypothetical protein